jgi:Beta-lactamase.
LPGVAYGLVVDGKLVYKGNIGYTDIEKKTPVTSSLYFALQHEQKFCSNGNFKIA